MTLDPILQTIQPVTHDLGGFKVHRTLPAKERTMVGPFLFFDQMGPAHLDQGEGIDVRPHPHINLATVTYLFDGAIDHRDSLGTDQRIEPGAVNLMTAGRGIVHSERSPGDERASGPALSGIQTWLTLPEADEEMDPTFEHVAAAELPMLEAEGARARIIMGELWGKRAATSTYAGTIYADIVLSPGAQVPVDAAAEERAVYLTEGAATLEGMPLEPQRLYVLRPGVPASRRRSGRRRAAAPCCAAATPSPARATFGGISCPAAATGSSRPGATGAPAPFPACPATRRSGSRSPTGRRRSATRDADPRRAVHRGRTRRPARGRPRRAAGHPAPRLPRVAPHLAAYRPGPRARPVLRRARPARLCALLQAGGRGGLHGRQDRRRRGRAGGRARDRAVHAGRPRLGRRGGLAAALSRPDRVERLVIVNAPHPLIFQRSLFDDPDQRAASQYITRFRDTRLEQSLLARGLAAFLRSSFAGHVAAAVAGEDEAAYVDEWSQPGALTGMLNWYRAFTIVVPAPGEDPPRPAWLDRPFPPVPQPTLVVWGTRDHALLPVQLDGLDALVPDLSVTKVDAGHFVTWEKPEVVVAAMRSWLP